MWVLESASPTGPTSNGQPDVEDFKAGSMREELNAPSEPRYFYRPLLLPECMWNQNESPLVAGGDKFPAWLVIKKRWNKSVSRTIFKSRNTPVTSRVTFVVDNTYGSGTHRVFEPRLSGYARDLP
jgi:hypothetical protein